MMEEHRSFMPKEFVARYEQILGPESKEFFRYCSLPLRKCIRVNTLKVSVDHVVERLERQGWRLERIPWTEDAFWILNRQEDKALGNTDEHFLGYFYVQEASSMIPPLVLQPKPHETVVDVAAAPGSKTTQMSAMMENKGLIVANDPNISRLKALRFNLEKAGCINVIVTRMDGAKIAQSNLQFDKILLDAPCSAEGTVRKDHRALQKWSPKLVHDLSTLQKHLLLNVVNRLKVGGTLVYSTCTLAPEENEEVVSALLAARKDIVVENVALSGLKTRSGMTEWNGKVYDPQVKNCARIYPHDNDSEGFFVTKLRRTE